MRWYIKKKNYPKHQWPNVYAEGYSGIWFFVNTTCLENADSFASEEEAMDQLLEWHDMREIDMNDWEVVSHGGNSNL